MLNIKKLQAMNVAGELSGKEAELMGKQIKMELEKMCDDEEGEEEVKEKELNKLQNRENKVVEVKIED